MELTQSLKETKIDTPRRTNVDFEEALEETGFGKYNIYLILTCGATLFATITETCGIGFTLPAAGCELNLNSYTKGILTSCTITGITASSMLWGFLSDIRGRKNLLAVTLLLSFGTTLIACFMPSFWGFLFFRLINGICIACPCSITFVYLGEFLCTTTRTKSMSSAVLFIAFAMTFLPAFGLVFLQRTFIVEFVGLKLTSWRSYILCNSLPNIVAALCLLRLPESPKYLYYSGKSAEALKVLKTMFATNTGCSEDSFPILSLDQKIYLEKSSSAKRSKIEAIAEQIVPLFKRPLLLQTVAACAMQAGLLAMSSGFLLWYPDIINQVAKSGKDSVTVCEALSGGFQKEESADCGETVNDRVFILNIIIGVYYIVCYCCWGVLVKLLNTRNFYITMMAISAVATFLLCFISHRTLIDIFFITGLVLPGVSVSVVNAWVVEIFPTNIGGMAICTTLTLGRMGSILASSMSGVMLEWNCTGTFVIYTLVLIICLLLSLLLPQKR